MGIITNRLFIAMACGKISKINWEFKEHPQQCDKIHTKAEAGKCARCSARSVLTNGHNELWPIKESIRRNCRRKSFLIYIVARCESPYRIISKIR